MTSSQNATDRQNADIVRSLYDVFNSRDFDRSAALVTEDYNGFVVPLGTTFRGAAGVKEFQLGWATAFPDSKVEIRSLTVDGNRVVVEHNGRGTHQGPLATPNGIVPATGRRVDIPFCEVFELRDGKVASDRTYFDVATMMAQLGLAGGPADSATAEGAPEAANVALARRWFGVMNSGALDQVTSIFAPSYRLHYPDMSADAVGPEVIRGLIDAYRQAFPDLHFEVDDAFGSDDTVLVRWTASGTNRGSLLGMPATGRFARWTGMSVLRVENGRIVEDWVENDRLGMLQQLGVVPAPEAHGVV
jgi:steroid delta-isomerase-like uncharacterized protein